MPTYENLNQRHPSYKASEQDALKALYEGGDMIDGQLPMLLPKRPAEHSDRHSLRKTEASYRNYIGPIIDFFTSMLFSTRPVLAAMDVATGEQNVKHSDYYSKLIDDCDGLGCDLDDLFKRQLTEAMVQGSSWVRIHAPDDAGVAPENAAQFENRRLGDCWLSAVEPARVLDWEYDDIGRISLAVVHSKESKRHSLSGGRDTITEKWEALFVDRVDVYAVTYKSTEKPQPRTEIQLVDTKPHTFGRVPIVRFELPSALHVAGRLKSPQIAHFRKNNALSWSLSSTCYAQAVFHIEDAARPPTMGAGYGIFMSPNEKVSWIAPPSGHFETLAKEVATEKDEIFRIAHQMALGVENNAAAVGRSGDSKQQDNQNTKVVLLSFARIVKEKIEVLLDMISAQRGDGLSWSVGGLDDFAASDISGMLEALEKIVDIGGIPSKTFNVEVKKRVAEAVAPDLDQATKAKIFKEIEEGTVEAEEAERTLLEIARGTGFGAPARSENGGQSRSCDHSPSETESEKRP